MMRKESRKKAKPPVPLREQGVSVKLRDMKYITVAMLLFLISAGLLVAAFVLVMVFGSVLGTLPGFFGMAAFAFALAGFIVTLYGHYLVKVEGKINWKVGLVCNFIMLAVTFSLYLAGLA